MIVQKFGGIAMQTASHREMCVQKVIDAVTEHSKTAVVLSAIGRSPDPYATDSLLSLLPKKESQTEASDLISSCGELISIAIFQQLLEQKGIKCSLCYGNMIGIRTDNQFGQATVIQLEKEKLLEALEKVECLIIAGFQGTTLEGKITTLGRGGSDLSAIYVAEMVNAQKVIFYKDVPGVLNKHGEMFDFLSYEQLEEICACDKPIIHSKATTLAKQWRIPLEITSFYEAKKGTIVEM
ncbi:aspartate kinase [Paenisporosarcina cavernae]|uniref:aspartate kinase n=1 Tax=Paenisporosarcina cavernae TaxID=2320858 RepID=A0A385YQT9_9BACL|nr:aspartate kinase [Paenisporosarcina cavernae]AYC29135.1 aspartate kinase [Paenisporosarcina cavernae]